MNAKTTNADKVARSTREEADRVGGALSGLIQAWINAGTQLAVGTTRAVATGIEDLSRTYCNVGTGKDETEKGTLAAPRTSLAKSVEECSNQVSRSVEDTSEAVRSACQQVLDACGSAAQAAGDAASTAASDAKSAARAEGSSS